MAEETYAGDEAPAQTVHVPERWPPVFQSGHTQQQSESQADALRAGLDPISSQPPAANEIVPMLVGATVGEVERELVLQTLARCNGNRTHAARVLGVSVRTLRNKIRDYAAQGIDVPAPGRDPQ